MQEILKLVDVWASYDKVKSGQLYDGTDISIKLTILNVRIHSYGQQNSSQLKIETLIKKW